MNSDNFKVGSYNTRLNLNIKKMLIKTSKCILRNDVCVFEFSKTV